MSAENILKKTGIQSLGAYIDRRQATVAKWVTLRPILEVCNRETGYEGGGRLWDTWWWKTAARKQLSATLKYILVAERERCWKSSRRGGGGGDRYAEE